MKVFADMMRMGPKAVGSGYIPTKSRSVLKEGDDVVAISLLNPGESGSMRSPPPKKRGRIPLRAFTPAPSFDVRRDACRRRPCGRRTSGRRRRPALPGWNDAKNAANGEGESASSSVSQEADTVVRMFMPDSGPASIAVATPEGVHYCWDAGTMQLRYAWTGDFLDPSNHFAGNGDALAGAGHIVWRTTLPHESEDRAFLGYRVEQVDWSFGGR